LQQRYPEIGDVRGIGMMNGLELVKENKAPDPGKANFIRNYFMDKKILILTCGSNKNVIRFIPPLNVEQALLDLAVQTLEEALKASRKS
jgi:4-aminobutyrate aminotransferase